MEARITIEGNRLEGYTLTLTLPHAFLSQFVHVNPSLFGRNVEAYWGYAVDSNENDSDREIVCIYDSLSKAEAEAEKIVKEIEYLNSLIKNEESVVFLREIPLLTLG